MMIDFIIVMKLGQFAIKIGKCLIFGDNHYHNNNNYYYNNYDNNNNYYYYYFQSCNYTKRYDDLSKQQKKTKKYDKQQKNKENKKFAVSRNLYISNLIDDF